MNSLILLSLGVCTAITDNDALFSTEQSPRDLAIRAVLPSSLVDNTHTAIESHDSNQVPVDTSEDGDLIYGDWVIGAFIGLKFAGICLQAWLPEPALKRAELHLNMLLSLFDSLLILVGLAHYYGKTQVTYVALVVLGIDVALLALFIYFKRMNVWVKAIVLRFICSLFSSGSILALAVYLLEELHPLPSCGWGWVLMFFEEVCSLVFFYHFKVKSVKSDKTQTR